MKNFIIKFISMFVSSVIFLVSPSISHSADSLCEVIALHDTEKSEYFPYQLKKGEKIDVVTVYEIFKRTGVAAFCQHGGGCYPAKSLKLLKCKINFKKTYYEDEDTKSFGLTLTRSEIDPEVLKEYDIEISLIRIGLCYACAGNAAANYIKNPNSECGKNVELALNGNQNAREWLKNSQCIKTVKSD